MEWTSADYDLFTRLVFAAELSWQVVEDEGFEDQKFLEIFRDARRRLALPERCSPFRDWDDG